MFGKLRAHAANDRGMVLADKGKHAEAIPHYLEAARTARGWWVPWFNLGIAYKHTRTS
jgi:hypothetical protein